MGIYSNIILIQKKSTRNLGKLVKILHSKLIQTAVYTESVQQTSVETSTQAPISIISSQLGTWQDWSVKIPSDHTPWEVIHKNHTAKVFL